NAGGDLGRLAGAALAQRLDRALDQRDLALGGLGFGPLRQRDLLHGVARPRLALLALLGLFLCRLRRGGLAGLVGRFVRGLGGRGGLGGFIRRLFSGLGGGGRRAYGAARGLGREGGREQTRAGECSNEC